MNETRIKNIRVLIVALIIILNLIIMANLIIKISERKRINSYNLEYNQTEKSEDSFELENYVFFARTYAGKMPTKYINSRAKKLTKQLIPIIYNNVYNTNEQEITKYYDSIKNDPKYIIEYKDLEDFKNFAQIITKTSNPSGRNVKCKLNLEEYKEDTNYAYFKMEVEYDNGLKLNFDVKFNMYENYEKGDVVKFIPNN